MARRRWMRLEKENLISMLAYYADRMGRKECLHNAPQLYCSERFEQRSDRVVLVWR